MSLQMNSSEYYGEPLKALFQAFQDYINLLSISGTWGAIVGTITDQADLTAYIASQLANAGTPGAVPAQVAWNSGVIPLDKMGQVMAPHTVAGAVAFSIAANPAPVNGGSCMVKLIANGTNVPTVTGLTRVGVGQYDNTNGVVNTFLFFRRANGENCYSVAQDNALAGIDAGDLPAAAVPIDPANRLLLLQGPNVTLVDPTDLGINGVVPDASETVKGISEFATAAETITGTDNTRATHSAGVKAAIDAREATIDEFAIAPTTAIPFTGLGVSMNPPVVISGATTFTVGASPKNGAEVTVPIVSNGVNTPDFSAFELIGSGTWAGIAPANLEIVIARFRYLAGVAYCELLETAASYVDVIAPTLTNATIPAAGNVINLAFSESVSIGAGGNGGFTIAMSGGAVTMTYASGSGSSTLVYNLSRTVQSGETCSDFDYTQPGNGVEDGAGNDLATFTNQQASVTNNSTQNTAWVPTDISGLIGWYKLNTGITGDPTVTAWADQSGAGNHIEASGGPQKQAAGTILLDGVDDYLDSGNNYGTPQPGTIYMRVKVITHAENDVFVSQRSGADGLAMGAATGSIYAKNTGNLASTATSSSCYSVGNWVTLMVAIGDGVPYVVKGGAQARVESSENASSGTGLRNPNFGTDINGFNRANVEYAEILVYNTIHDASQNSTVFAYMNAINP